MYGTLPQAPAPGRRRRTGARDYRGNRVQKAPAGFRIVHDRDLCQDHLVCVSEAPEVFSIDENKQVVIASDVDPADREAIEKAVKYCPTGALSLEEIDD